MEKLGSFALNNPKIMLELSMQLQQILHTDATPMWFIKCAKSYEETRKKWQTSENRLKELERETYTLKQENTKLQRQVNELKVDVEIHYEKRLQAESDRDLLIEQIDEFKRILNTTTAHSFSQAPAHITRHETNQAHKEHKHIPRLSSFNSRNIFADETVSLITDYTLDGDNEHLVIDKKHMGNYLDLKLRNIDDSSECEDSSPATTHKSRKSVSLIRQSKSNHQQESASGRVRARSHEINSPNTSIKATLNVDTNGTPMHTPRLQAHMRKRREHNFEVNPARLSTKPCAHCDKRSKYGRIVYKCKSCDLVLHCECKDAFKRACYLPYNYPTNGTCISDYVNMYDDPKVPAFMQYLCDEIEDRGLDQEVALYKCAGSDFHIRSLKDKLIRHHQLPNLNKIKDVHDLCGFLKEFLSNLNEHLITFSLWNQFANADNFVDEEKRDKCLKDLLYELPIANRDTLSFLILHLKKISKSPNCKMSAQLLAHTLGPCIVGNSRKDISNVEIVQELRIQQQIVFNLLQIDTKFYEQILYPERKSKLFINSHNTPLSIDILRKSKTASVLSSILGPGATPSRAIKTSKFGFYTPAIQHELRSTSKFKTPKF